MHGATAAIVDRFYDAWNRHGAAAIREPFAADGRYADPLTRGDLVGKHLTDHMQSVLDVIRDLRLTVIRTSPKLLGRGLCVFEAKRVTTWLGSWESAARAVSGVRQVPSP